MLAVVMNARRCITHLLAALVLIALAFLLDLSLAFLFTLSLWLEMRKVS